jgi:hypothetical protein
VSFLSKQPQLEDYWRGIVLFGKNAASYKFALAKSLLELKPASGDLIKLGDLAPIYSENIAKHLKQTDTQGTARSSKFLDCCRNYNAESINRDELTEFTIRFGFNNVIDAFHVVGETVVPERFYFDERKSNNGIRITDEFSELLHCHQSGNLPSEVEARWNLVETAWDIGVSRGLVSIGYDEEHQALFALDNQRRRKSVTGSRDALSGYQKGKCFYCFSDISIDDVEDKRYPDVDHFFPHVLKHQGLSNIIDGVWNLVLSCKECNRGEGGKFASVPTIKLLGRLHRRNEFLITSHHPLRETLIQQTGITVGNRQMFLNAFHEKSWAKLIHTWEAIEQDEPYF